LANTSLTIDDAMFETDVPGLWFMPAGRPNPRGPELLAGSRMRELRQQFLNMGAGWIIIYDSPPVLASNEAQSLAQHVSCILMVVRAGLTSPQTLKEALTIIGDTREISFVLNRVADAPGSAYGGYYQSEPTR
jgi:receptor protein-tyrosine kinase